MRKDKEYSMNITTWRYGTYYSRNSIVLNYMMPILLDGA